MKIPGIPFGAYLTLPYLASFFIAVGVGMYVTNEPKGIIGPFELSVHMPSIPCDVSGRVIDVPAETEMPHCI